MYSAKPEPNLTGKNLVKFWAWIGDELKQKLDECLSEGHNIETSTYYSLVIKAMNDTKAYKEEVLPVIRYLSQLGK
jgi:hypothetical protein